MKRGYLSRWCVVTIMCASFGAGCVEDPVDVQQPDPPDEVGRYWLVDATGSAPSLPVGDVSTVSVVLVDSDLGAGAAGEEVTFRVQEGTAEGRMTARRTRTDDTGRADVGLRAGGRPGTLTVVASHPRAEPLHLPFQVNTAPTGALEIDITHGASSITELTDVDVRLYRADDLSCTGFRPYAPSASQGEILRRERFDAPGEVARFDSLPVDEELVAAAVARGEHGQIAASGCIEDVRVISGVPTSRDIVLAMLPLTVDGVYATTSHWDFSAAVEESGAVGEQILRVLNLFHDPGRALYEEIVTLVTYLVGGVVGGSLDFFLEQTGLDREFQTLIDRAIQNNGAMCRIREAGRDLRDVIAQLTVHSETSIAGPQSGYSLRGRDNWLGITLYWRGLCDDGYLDACRSGTDAGPPARRKRPCAAIPMVADPSGEIAGLGLLSSTWSGRLTGYDRLEVQHHDIPLRYGRLITLLLNDTILPALTAGEARSLAEAFGYWLRCDGLARSVTGADGRVCALGRCLYREDIVQTCDSAVQGLFGTADLLLEQLAWETGVSVGGHATAIETDSDGRVDRLEMGRWSGRVDVATAEGRAEAAEVTGRWSGQRAGEP